MRERLLITIGAVITAVAAASLVPAHVAGQSPPQPKTTRPAANATSVPRTADGHPDLQGTYDLATLTPMERPAGMPAMMSEAEAAKLEKQIARQKEVAAAPIK